MADLVAGAETCCGCSAPLRSCERSSRDLTVCVLTGRNLGPSPQYFAQGNHFHSSATYRRKSGTMVPETGEKTTANKHNVLIKEWHNEQRAAFANNCWTLTFFSIFDFSVHLLKHFGTCFVEFSWCWKKCCRKIILHSSIQLCINCAVFCPW